MAHSVRRHLSVEIDAYDATIRTFIPGYEAMLAAAADRIASDDPSVVLDIGAGTGALAEAVLARGAAEVVELLDIDPEMLARARQRLARFDSRARFRLGSFHDPLPRCDAAMASLALHHVATLEEKRALYARLAAALPAGGVFVNADVALPRDPEGRHAAYASWAAHQVGNGIPEDRAWANFEAWAEEDTYFSVDEELDALDRAGFAAESVWRDGPIAVLVGRKR